MRSSRVALAGHGPYGSGGWEYGTGAAAATAVRSPTARAARICAPVAEPQRGLSLKGKWAAAEACAERQHRLPGLLVVLLPLKSVHPLQTPET